MKFTKLLRTVRAGGPGPFPLNTRAGLRSYTNIFAAKATAAKKAVVKGSNGKKALKVRTSATFRLPKTLKLARRPAYASKSVPHYNRLDSYKVIEQPITSETAMKKVEDGNTLVFQVSIKSNKHQIQTCISCLGFTTRERTRKILCQTSTFF